MNATKGVQENTRFYVSLMIVLSGKRLQKGIRRYASCVSGMNATLSPVVHVNADFLPLKRFLDYIIMLKYFEYLLL